jgi:hypothetical protein
MAETRRQQPHGRAIAVPLPTSKVMPTTEWIALLVLLLAIIVSPLIYDLALALGATR